MDTRYYLDVFAPATGHPAICLNMIVRNEAHIVAEALDAIAPFISSWVIVDTGSVDGTQDLIRNHMARLGIPGELHERPWRNFGNNRTEALALAQNHGDYIWVIDADDAVIGTPNFDELRADVYQLRYRQAASLGWRPQLFRDGLGVRYEGVVHEHVVCDDPFTHARLEGEYHIEARSLGARGVDPQKYARDRDLLLAEVDRNPGDARSMYYLAQSYFEMGDFASARIWYARRADMGGFPEEVYHALFRIAESMANQGESWPDIQDAYLRAWEFRPGRAEPLHAIAWRYRVDQRYRLGYLFAEQAAKIPFPEEETLPVAEDVYAWRATDEQAVCASWIGKQAEAFTLWRRLLARADLPDEDRQRIAANRDICVPTMVEAAASYPDALVRSLTAGRRDSDVVVSLVGRDLGRIELTLNSFLNCCLDLSRIRSFLVVDAGLSAAHRATLVERYGFLNFADPGPDRDSSARLVRVRSQVKARFWLDLGEGWQFFASDELVSRLTAVFDCEPEVFQVAINLADAVELTGMCAPEATVRRTPDGGRYVLTEQVAYGPAMFDTTRLDRVGGEHAIGQDPIATLGQRAADAGLCTASLDEVLCTAAVDRSRPRGVEVGHPRRWVQLGSGIGLPSPTRFAVAIVSPRGYEHSDVFREVAEAVHFGLVALGHDSVLTNRLDLDERVTIVLGSNLLARYEIEPPKNAILYNLEQVDADSAWITPALLDLFRRYPVWDYSQANIARLAAWGVPRLTHVPIGYVPQLTRIAPGPEDIDVLWYGSPDERREAVLEELRARGLCVKSLFGVYGPSRDRWIARSKLVVNIHVSYYKAQVLEIVRISYLLANRRAVVSERGADPAEERDLGSGIAFAEYDQFADRCIELVRDERARRELGERGYRAFAARSQTAILRRALAAGLD